MFVSHSEWLFIMFSSEIAIATVMVARQKMDDIQKWEMANLRKHMLE